MYYLPDLYYNKIILFKDQYSIQFYHQFDNYFKNQLYPLLLFTPL